MSKLDFLDKVSNETFMRYLVQDDLFVLISIMKLISHKCFN